MGDISAVSCLHCEWTVMDHSRGKLLAQLARFEIPQDSDIEDSDSDVVPLDPMETELMDHSRGKFLAGLAKFEDPQGSIIDDTVSECPSFVMNETMQSLHNRLFGDDLEEAQNLPLAPFEEIIEPGMIVDYNEFANGIAPNPYTDGDKINIKKWLDAVPSTTNAGIEEWNLLPVRKVEVTTADPVEIEIPTNHSKATPETLSNNKRRTKRSNREILDANGTPDTSVPRKRPYRRVKNTPVAVAAQPSAVNHPKSARSKKVKLQVNFKPGTLPNQPIPYEVQFADVKVKSPKEYFHMFFTEEMIRLVVHQTNIYSMQKSRSAIPFKLTELEFKKFLKIELIMSFIKMPAYTDYWGQKYGHHAINSVMSLKKYQNIRSNLHFANLNEIDSCDGYGKIREFMEMLRHACNAVPNEIHQSIDEMMVAYTGTRAGSKKQYMPQKPTKYGLKLFGRAGISGFLYDFILYDGAKTFYGRHNSFDEDEKELPFSQAIVIALMKTVNVISPVICIDNFFTSFELMNTLRKKYKANALGTIRSCRIQNTDMSFPKNSPRGTYKELVDEKHNLFLVKWLDGREVFFCSNFVGAEPVQTAERWFKGDKKSTVIPCPYMVQLYNKNMGGVDLVDQLIAQNKTEFRTHKWYMRLFAEAFDIAVNNAWVLMKRDYLATHKENMTMSLKQFRMLLAEGILPDGIENPSTPCGFSKLKIGRYDREDHYIDFGTTRKRCKLCQDFKTTTYCEKCVIHLCNPTTGRKCFKQYHTKPSINPLV